MTVKPNGLRTIRIIMTRWMGGAGARRSETWVGDVDRNGCWAEACRLLADVLSWGKATWWKGKGLGKLHANYP